jgi:hypothetical protein
MLSDEEKAIEELKNKEADYFMISNLTGKTLVNLIEKQSKEIEELKEENKKKSIVIIEYQDLYEKLQDKIKAKIEEAEKIIKEDRKELNFGNTLRDDILQGIVYKIDFNTRLKNILESLLEKE